ncbi:D-3-phosphoglycerate dehydrogenase [Pedococcus dokdonensis]|uniref:D-3-phosphoglycerate dehydrogenase n=1 Tax=Pedococcus dokdonensis TaxID=443156 RepID=A0A1H0TQM7_9MICO|nr:D-2-hydroxyacid dehydrogenase family protein [Pedococcus dokdonensis]SDP56095.1 D-3-phosphoglycerate dehydrogenase [Pedococcus dokdonensis]
MRIAVLDDHAGVFGSLPAAARLAGHDVVAFTDPVRGDDLVARLDGFDAVVLLQQRTPLPADVVERLRTLRMVSQTGRNTSHLALAALAERGVVVSAGGAGGPNATAELTWALVLAAQRHLPAEVAALRDGRWQSTVGIGLNAKTLGVYGLGRIGSLVADVGRAFGMDVLVWGREGSLVRAEQAGYAVAESREDFFRACDVLCVHLPLNADTAGIVTADDLAEMKPDALFVNTSRAGLVAPGALVAALLAGRPGRAAVDVFDDEPVLGAADPLLTLPTVTATPHLGYVERDVLAGLYDAAVDQLLAFAAGTPINVVGS